MEEISDEVVSLKMYAQAWDAKLSGRVDEAVAIFTNLRNIFPLSKEAEYAAVHIEEYENQKLKKAEVPLKNDVDSPNDQREVLAMRSQHPKRGVLVFFVAILSLLFSFFVGYKVWSLEKRMEFNETLSAAREAFKNGDKQLFERRMVKAHRLSGKDNRAVFLEVDAALSRGDIDAALKVIKRAPVVNEEVRLYIDKIMVKSGRIPSAGGNK